MTRSSELEVAGWLHPVADTWILHFIGNAGKNPLPMNGSRGNHHAHSKAARAVRAEAYYRAKGQAHIPPLGHCRAQLTWWVKSTAITRDVDNLAELEKRLFDGLVDAGVVVDDKPALMEKPRGVIRALADADGLVTAPCFTLTVTRLGGASSSGATSGRGRASRPLWERPGGAPARRDRVEVLEGSSRPPGCRDRMDSR